MISEPTDFEIIAMELKLPTRSFKHCESTNGFSITMYNPL